MRISNIPLLFFLFIVVSSTQAGEGAESLGPVVTEAVKFPCVEKSIDPIEHIVYQDQPDEATSHKSPGKAFFLSLLVPGLGEFYAGSPSKAKIFLAVEAAVWSGFAAFEQYSAWKRRDYELLAVAHAGVNLDGKDDDFFKDVEMYTDIWSYNQEQLHARDMDDVYWDEALYFWEWDSEASRTAFGQLRTSSRKARRRAVNIVGVAVLNRLVSAIDALRTARAFNERREEEGSGFSLDFKIRGSLRNPKALVVLEKNF